MSRENITTDLLNFCYDFTENMLNELTRDEIGEIDATDTNWCYKSFEENYCDSEEEAVNRAYFSAYEQIMEDRARRA